MQVSKDADYPNPRLGIQTGIGLGAWIQVIQLLAGITVYHASRNLHTTSRSEERRTMKVEIINTKRIMNRGMI